MKLYLIENYKCGNSSISGKELTEFLVKKILAGNGLQDPVIRRTPEGKPYLENSGLFFSVSHTGDTFGCLISDENAGLDLQYARSLDHRKLAKRYYTAEEQEYTETHGLEGFFRIWTRKEAFSKYSGRGLADIVEKEPVLGREDVVFTELPLGGGLFGCCCKGRRSAGEPEAVIEIVRVDYRKEKTDEDLFSD